MYINSRRKFLQQSALITGGLMMPGFLSAFDGRLPQTNGYRRLIIIQLSGGNDGLNTTIPFEDDLYYKNRQGLSISAKSVIPLENGLGFNPSMSALRKHWDQGRISILNNVGYPNPDRSHFRSMDIWHTASDSDTYIQTGWLGRYLDNRCKDDEKNKSCKAPVLELDDSLSLALKGQTINGIAAQDPQRLYKTTSDPWFDSLSKRNFDQRNSELGFLYKTLSSTVSSAQFIYSHFEHAKAQEEFPSGPFGQQLKTTAALIRSGIPTAVYYVSLSGFDTHVRQKPTQNRLLKNYAEGVSALMSDLEKAGELDNTLILTFSEFGRRVKQNASGGTDHGTANNVYLMGGRLKKPGIFNEAPNLSALDKGDLIFSLDFRQVYASLLEDWLETDSGIILGRKFDKLQLV